jgi:fatty acid amide hydrolase
LDTTSNSTDGHPTTTPDKLTCFGAAELARRIADGVTTSVEVVEAHIARIEALQSRFNMMTRERFELARVEAEAADRRREADEALPLLNGVPISVKECFHLKGLPTNLGVTGSDEKPAERDSHLIRKLKDAGAIVIAKTNIPQLMLYMECDNPRFGRTINPWDESRTCGGSSGGEAVMLATGGSALGVGSDMGGSLRVPAHYCGVHAFKPTSKLLSDTGMVVGLPGMNAIPNVPGFIARSVEDLAVGLRVGRQKPIPYERRYGPRFGENLTGTRVAVLNDHEFFPVSPAIKRVVDEAANCLAKRGAELVPFDPPDFRQLMGLFFSALSADGGVAVRRQLAGSQVDQRLQTLLRLSMFPGVLRRATAATLRHQRKTHAALILESTRKRTTDEYWQICTQLEQFRQRLVTNWRANGLHLLLAPPAGLTAVPHGKANDLVTSIAYSVLANVLDFPAGVLAVSRVRDNEQTSRDPTSDPLMGLAARIEHGTVGLPVGVQIIGSPFHDRLVLGTMLTLESHFARRSEYPITVAAGLW